MDHEYEDCFSCQPSISNSLPSIDAKDRGKTLFVAPAGFCPLRGVSCGTAGLYNNVERSLFCLVGIHLPSISSLAENIIASP